MRQAGTASASFAPYSVLKRTYEDIQQVCGWHRTLVLLCSCTLLILFKVVQRAREGVQLQDRCLQPSACNKVPIRRTQYPAILALEDSVLMSMRVQASSEQWHPTQTRMRPGECLSSSAFKGLFTPSKPACLRRFIKLCVESFLTTAISNCTQKPQLVFLPGRFQATGWSAYHFCS